jgi:peptidoglycan-associated lipoprotein
MKQSYLLLILIVLLSSCSVEKKATKEFRRGNYQTAIGLYKKILNRNSNNAKANYFIAESYRLSNRLKEAGDFYQKAGGRGIDNDSVKFFYAQSLKANEKYSDAREQFEALSKETRNEKFKDRVEDELRSINYLEKLNGIKNYYKIKNLELLNTPAAEFAPAFLNNELYFTSSRGNGKIYEATGTPFLTLTSLQWRHFIKISMGKM